MRTTRWIVGAIVLAALTCLPAAAQATDMTWAETLRSKIDTLGMSDGQRVEIKNAFDASDKQYNDAILATRGELGNILTADQKTQLGQMADKAMQNYFSGQDVKAGKSIKEIADKLGISKEQSAAFKQSLKSLSGKLDSIDADLMQRIKGILRPDQIEKIKSWLL